MKKYPSLFNDVLTPITRGPSSSATCGPSRISWVCRQIFGTLPKQMVVEMPAQSTYPYFYMSMKSDIAFINGMLNRDPCDPRFDQAYQDAESNGMKVEFRFVDNLEIDPIVMVRIIMTDENGTVMTVKGSSPGGGSFIIDEIDGCKVEIQGNQYELLFFCDAMTPEKVNTLKLQIEQNAKNLNDVIYSENEIGKAVYCIKLSKKTDAEAVKRLETIVHAERSCQIEPILPVVANAGLQPVFETPEEMLKYAEETGLESWELAITYEKSVSGWDEKEVWAYAENLWEVIVESEKNGYLNNLEFNGIITPKAIRLKEMLEQGKGIPMGTMDSSILSALAIMEYSNSSGTIACIPTAGAAGIVPGSIMGAAKSMNLDREEQIRALLVSGLAGMLMAKCSFSGSMGCQAEVGCAVAMAAAALTHFLHGTPSQMCDAASMGIQSTIGLVCDTVCGLVQSPCIVRNITGTAAATAIANAVMAGVEAVIPLSEMVEALIRVGKSLKMTGCNKLGACITPTGLKLDREQIERNILVRELKKSLDQQKHMDIKYPCANDKG